MNHRERIEATIRGERQDRVALALWRHWPGDDQRAEDLAAAVLRFQRDYDFDFIKVTPSSSYCLEDWGAHTRWVGNQEGTREHVSYPIRAADDWLCLPILDPAQGSLGEQLRCLSLVCEGAEGTPFLPTIFSPLAQAKHLVGSDQLLAHLRQHPAALKRGLETITETTTRFVRATLKTGCAGIFYAVQHASYNLLSAAEYAEFGRPYDLRILEAATASGGWFNLLHLHGTNTLFDAVADYPVQAINWHDRETPPTLAEAMGHTRAALCGGIDRNVVLQGTPDDVRAQAADAIAQVGGRGLIIATGCVILITSPICNIRAAREAV